MPSYNSKRKLYKDDQITTYNKLSTPLLHNGDRYPHIILIVIFHTSCTITDYTTELLVEHVVGRIEYIVP